MINILDKFFRSVGFKNIFLLERGKSFGLRYESEDACTESDNAVTSSKYGEQTLKIHGF